MINTTLLLRTVKVVLRRDGLIEGAATCGASSRST
jgi:hypothetical protein